MHSRLRGSALSNDCRPAECNRVSLRFSLVYLLVDLCSKGPKVIVTVNRLDEAAAKEGQDLQFKAKDR